MKIFKCHRSGTKGLKKLKYQYISWLLESKKLVLSENFVKEEKFPASRLIYQFIKDSLCRKTLKTKRSVLTGQGTNMRNGIKM